MYIHILFHWFYKYCITSHHARQSETHLGFFQSVLKTKEDYNGWRSDNV